MACTGAERQPESHSGPRSATPWYCASRSLSRTLSDPCGDADAFPTPLTSPWCSASPPAVSMEDERATAQCIQGRQRSRLIRKAVVYLGVGTVVLLFIVPLWLIAVCVVANLAFLLVQFGN